jgi:lipopolysaccharide/colanic/teichoic acid biosynthesis glycosyltransferase
MPIQHAFVCDDLLRKSGAKSQISSLNMKQKQLLRPHFRLYRLRLPFIAVRLLQLAILLFFFPVIILFCIIISAGIYLTMRRPILFCQRRVGYRERIFTLWKFRTLRPLADLENATSPDSERVTQFGKWLRATHLDELPQCWNILRGEMNFIGPRPLLPEYLPYYSATQRKRHDVKPGITGWAQVNGGNRLSWPERLALDAFYADNYSIWLDARIIWRTFLLVWQRKSTPHWSEPLSHMDATVNEAANRTEEVP